MTLLDLQALGAYAVAGSVQIYTGGQHVHLGDVIDGDDAVAFSDAGRAFANALMAKRVIEILAVDLPVIDVSAPIPVTVMPNDLSALDAALAH